MGNEKLSGGRQRSLPDRVVGKLSQASWHAVKLVYRLSHFRTKEEKQILIVVGCQRSGTTMLMRVLDADHDSEVYSEHSRRLTSSDREERLRLNALDATKRTLDKSPFPLIVIKPLVETQRVDELLEHFPNAKALWLYRHYKDVALSNLRRFGLKSGVNNLRPIVELRNDNWRAERLSDALRSVVTRYFHDGMSCYDAAALFWYVRNSLFFHMNLDEHPRVMLLQYEALVGNPRSEIDNIYRFLGRSRSAAQAASLVHGRAVGGGSSIELSPEIRQLCEQLWAKLNGACTRAHAFDDGLSRSPSPSSTRVDKDPRGDGGRRGML